MKCQLCQKEYESVMLHSFHHHMICVGCHQALFKQMSKVIEIQIRRVLFISISSSVFFTLILSIYKVTISSISLLRGYNLIQLVLMISVILITTFSFSKDQFFSTDSDTIRFLSRRYSRKHCLRYLTLLEYSGWGGLVGLLLYFLSLNIRIRFYYAKHLPLRMQRIPPWVLEKYRFTLADSFVENPMEKPMLISIDHQEISVNNYGIIYSKNELYGVFTLSEDIETNVYLLQSNTLYIVRIDPVMNQIQFVEGSMYHQIFHEFTDL